MGGKIPAAPNQKLRNLSLFVVMYMVSHIFFIGYGYENRLVRARSKGNLSPPSRQAEPAVPAPVTSPSMRPYGDMRQPLDGLAAALRINC